MEYPSRIILFFSGSQSVSETPLAPIVEQALRDRVRLIAIVGSDCEQLDRAVDELIVGDGSDQGRFIPTTCHPNETLHEVMDFVLNYDMHVGGNGIEVQLTGAPLVIEL